MRTADHTPGRELGRAIRTVFSGEGAVARTAAAAIVVATVGTQHHHLLAYNRIQRKDRYSLLPNWRFFAPDPGVHDYHFLYRTAAADGGLSRWNGIDLESGRRPGQMFWFPKRRVEKAFFDISVELVSVIDRGFPVIMSTTAYRLLDGYVANRVRRERPDAAAYQIAMVKSGGYDTGAPPRMVMLCPLVPAADGDRGHGGHEHEGER